MRRDIRAAAVMAAAVTILVGAATWTTRADQSAAAPRTITAADYARAEKALGAATTPLVFGLTVQPTWLPDGRMRYRADKSDGTSDTILVDSDCEDADRLFTVGTRVRRVGHECGTWSRRPCWRPGPRGPGRRARRPRWCGGERHLARRQNARPSFATGISGCATSRPARRRS